MNANYYYCRGNSRLFCILAENQIMAAPEGNQFWKLRSKHGRDKIFSSGDVLYETGVEYLEHLYNMPLKEHDFVGKDATEVLRNKKHVPTWAGFALFCGVNSKYFEDIERRYKNSEDELEKDIYGGLRRVNDLFFHDKFSAAAAGLANPNLIGKDLQLIDKLDVTTDGNAIQSVPLVLSNGKSLDDLMSELKPE